MLLIAFGTRAISQGAVSTLEGERVCELRSNPSGVFEISIPSTCYIII